MAPIWGKLTIEALVKAEMELSDIQQLCGDLELLFNRPDAFAFVLGEDILADDYTATVQLGDLYAKAKHAFHFMKVGDYSGGLETVVSSSNAEIRIHPYQLYGTPAEKELEQAEIISMPHTQFDRKWESLVFEDDFKRDLIRIMTNMLRFRGKLTDVNSLMLLHGPPGTGKTTLCQGLAQKISIRLNTSYFQTKLVQIKTANLLSKYYSESAKKVDEIFTAIEIMCDEDEDQFICVLIDEVESIASSRQSSMLGEAQDTLRATNAFLTGLDRVKKYHNIVFLCTSNMFDSLDAAFVDRCGYILEVNFQPSAIQYEILRQRLQDMICKGIIISEVAIPSYRDATLGELAHGLGVPENTSLLNVVRALDTTSGRTLSQLPEKSIIQYLGEEEDCTLEMALEFIIRNVGGEKRRTSNRNVSNMSC